jgi:secondary thiamine-phosphate synthase enzyme
MKETLQVRTRRRTEMLDVTAEVAAATQKLGIRDGAVLVFVPHTTAGVTINENADPSVPRDILHVLDRVIPFEDDYHHLEGNSAAHIKSSLMGPSLLLPIEKGRLVLGTWQGIFFCEFDGPRSRQMQVFVV